MTDRWARGILLFILVALYVFTLKKWGSVVIDCGREMYIPALLSQGKRLYFDAWYLYGPLIPYWHGLLFRIFGIHLNVLYATGFFLVTAISALLYSVSRVLLPVWLSFAAVFAFLLQAFQLTIFNYVLPYAYPSAYGVLFTLLLLWILIRNSVDPKPWHMVLAGFIAGLLGLTKVEFGAAGYGVLATAILIRAVRSRSIGGVLKDLAALIPGLVLFVAVYWWLVAHSSLDFLFGENMSILPSSWFVSKFGKRWAEMMGLSTSPSVLLRSALEGLAGFAVVTGAVWAAGRSRVARLAVVAIGVLIPLGSLALDGAELVLHRTAPSWLTGIAPFFFFNSGMVWVSLGLLAAVLFNWRRLEARPSFPALVMIPLLAIFSTVRVLTVVTPNGYSVFFDTLAYVAWLVALYYVAQELGWRTGDGIWRGVGLLFCFAVFCLTAKHYPVNKRPSLIHTARGDIYVQKSIGPSFNKVLEFLNEATARSERFVVLPEETSMYFFTGTEAPSRWYNLLPPVLPPNETRAYLDELDRNKVEYVVLSDRATPEYGVPIFGVDYAQELYQWIDQNFMPVKQIGDYQRVPEPPEWAARIYKRRTSH